MDGLAEYADMAANKTLCDAEIRDILNELFPITEKTTEREKATIAKCKDEFIVCYFAPDITKFRGTAWGAVNAMSDMLSHNAPRRKTAHYRENNWNRIMDGHAMLDKMTSLLIKAA